MLLDKFDDRVRRHAHNLWEREGKPHGRNDEFWSRAHAEMMVVVEREDRIRAKAHRLWQQAGKPTAPGDRFWFAAERVIASP